MKIKKNKKPVKKLALSGTSDNQWTNGSGPTNGKSTAISGWGNLATDSGAKTKSSGVSASQVGGYAGAAAGALSPLWESSKYYQPKNEPMDVAGGAIKGIASNIPIAGAFVQAGDMLGKGLDTGANKALAKGNQSAADAAYFFKGMTDPISNYSTIDKLRRAGKLSTGEAVGMGLTHLIGGPGFSEMMLQKKFKKDLHPDLYQTDPVQDYNQKFFNRPNEEPMQAAFGGSLEHYNLPKHSQLPTDFANAQMDGQGVQLEKNETKLKFPHGGGQSDYAFSPNLGFDKNKQPTINEKNVKLTFADASKKIENKKTFGFDVANQNSQKYAFNNLKEVAEATRIAKEGPDEVSQDVPLAKNGKSGNSLMNYPKKHGNPLRYPGSVWEDSRQLEPNFGDQTLKTMPVGSDDILYNAISNPNGTTALNIPDNTKHKLKIKRTNQEKAGDKSKMAPGDIAQLVGSAVAPIGNLAMYLGSKPEKVNTQLDTTQYSDPRIAKNFNPLYLAENAARQGINDGSNSDAVRRANLIGLASNMAGKAQDYSLGVDAANAQAMLGRDQMVSGTSRFNAQMRDRAADLQAQNDARRRSFLTTGLGQTGQAGVETGKAMNATRTTDIYGNILANYAADYTMDTNGKLVFKKANGGNLKLKKKKK